MLQCWCLNAVLQPANFSMTAPKEMHTHTRTDTRPSLRQHGTDRNYYGTRSLVRLPGPSAPNPPLRAQAMAPNLPGPQLPRGPLVSWL